MTPEELESARAAVSKIPVGAGADWDGTNHYEVTVYEGEQGDEDPFWLVIPGIDGVTDSSTQDGQRLGAVLDAACWARPLLDEVEALRTQVQALEARHAARVTELLESEMEWRRQAEGRVFVRPTDEFDDGRFTEVRHG